MPIRPKVALSLQDKYITQYNMPEVITSVSKIGHQFQIYCIHLNMLWFYFICIYKNRIRAVNSCSPSISQCWRRIPSTDFLCKLYCFAWVLSHIQLFETPWTIACHIFLSMGLSQQEYWRRLTFSPPGDLHDPRIDPVFSVASVLAGGFLPLRDPGSFILNSNWNGINSILSINFSYFFFEIRPLELLDSYIYYKPKHLNNIFGEVPILVEWNTVTFCYRSY